MPWQPVQAEIWLLAASALPVGAGACACAGTDSTIRMTPTIDFIVLALQGMRTARRQISTGDGVHMIAATGANSACDRQPPVKKRRLGVRVRQPEGPPND